MYSMYGLYTYPLTLFQPECQYMSVPISNVSISGSLPGRAFVPRLKRVETRCPGAAEREFSPAPVETETPVPCRCFLGTRAEEAEGGASGPESETSDENEAFELGV